MDIRFFTDLISADTDIRFSGGYPRILADLNIKNCEGGVLVSG